jgi:hypothetical protein
MVEQGRLISPDEVLEFLTCVRLLPIEEGGLNHSMKANQSLILLELSPPSGSPCSTTTAFFSLIARGCEWGLKKAETEESRSCPPIRPGNPRFDFLRTVIVYNSSSAQIKDPVTGSEE